MVIYILPLVYILICNYFRKDNKQFKMNIFKKNVEFTYDELFLTGLFGFLFILSAFRNFEVGTDTSNYIGHLASFMIEGFPFLIDLDMEIGYKILIVIASIFNSPRLLIILSSLIICVGNYFIIKRHSKDYYLSSFLYIALYLFSISLNVQRQAIAIIFIFEYVMSLYDENYKRSVIFLLLACLFHMTSLFMVIVIPIYYLTKRKELSQYLEELGIFLLSVCFFLFDFLFAIIVMVFPKYKFYIEHATHSNAMVKNEALLYVLVFCIGFVALYTLIYKWKGLKYKSLVVKYKDYILGICLLLSMVLCITNNRMIGLLYLLVLALHRLRFGNDKKDLIYYLSFISIFILFLQSKMSIFDRLVWYFFAFLVILIPQICKGNKFFKIIIYGISFAFYIRLLLVNSCEIVPYTFF